MTVRYLIQHLYDDEASSDEEKDGQDNWVVVSSLTNSSLQSRACSFGVGKVVANTVLQVQFNILEHVKANNVELVVLNTWHTLPRRGK